MSSAVKGIIIYEGRLLLQLRDTTPGIYCPGCWGLFGGTVDKGEAPSQALRRELDEELALKEFDMEYQFSWENLSTGTSLWFFAVLPNSSLASLRLNEGQAMRVFDSGELTNLSLTDDLRQNIVRVRTVVDLQGQA